MILLTSIILGTIAVMIAAAAMFSVPSRHDDTYDPFA